MALPSNNYSVTQRWSDTETGTMLTNDNVFPPFTATQYITEVLKNYVADNSVDLAGKKIAVYGAGVGNVALGVKWNHPDATVIAYENHEESFNFIQPNAELVGLSITAKKEDVTTLSDEKFDVIVSCPPYLPQILVNLPVSHSWENAPAEVTMGGYKGMEKVQSFADSAVNNLKKGGIFVTLHSTLQTSDVAAYLEIAFKNITNVNNPEFGKNLDLVDPSFTIAVKK